MGSPSFCFKKFEVFHDRCAMKVGTDGVLLGAWVEPREAQSILDVGTGSGLIALILAQRSKAVIHAVEFDPEAAVQAAENANRSLWSDRIRIFQADYGTYSDGRYDLIVSNPPFFRKSLKTPEKSRTLARHTDTLSYETLVEKTTELLTQAGRFCVILPFEAVSDFEEICWKFKLYPSKICPVVSVEGMPPKRVLLEFSRVRSTILRTELMLETIHHQRTAEFSALTTDLYLDK